MNNSHLTFQIPTGNIALKQQHARSKMVTNKTNVLIIATANWKRRNSDKIAYTATEKLCEIMTGT